MRPGTQEATFLESIVPDLEAEGFEVFVQPSPHTLPTFMRDYWPDAIARGKNKNLVIEIVREGQSSDDKTKRLRELLRAQKDWELRVYFVTPDNTVKSLEATSSQTIAQVIQTVEDLLKEHRTAPALLMAWATFEALGRALLPDKFMKPQTPKRLVEVLASNGRLTPTEADVARQLIDTRNKLIHGALQTEVASRDVRSFVTVLKTLQEFLSARNS